MATATNSTASSAARPSQTAISLAYAGLIFGGWLVLHVLGVFGLELSGWSWLAAVPLVAALTWLNVGLFIVAHDCMHGSFAPGRPRMNLWVGRVALFVYAGFFYDRLLPKHHDHHRHAGTSQDPDFAASHPRHFWLWYVQFFRTYFGWSQIAVLAAWFWGYTLLLGAPVANTLLFWALPSILSSLQLFTFGTYLPHRHEHEEGEDAFRDRHNARSNDYPGWLSLLTCFHFVNTTGFDRQTATQVTALALLVFAALQPLFGLLSDRIGRKPLLLAFGVGGLLVTVPVFNALGTVQTAAGAFGLALIPLVVLAPYTAVGAIIKAELFPAHIRTLGVALPYALANAAFGGTAEAVALKFKDLGVESAFGWYITALIAVALVAFILVPESRRASLIRDH